MAEKKFPEIIYKYRKWGEPYQEAPLRDNELWLASPESFNDPFDCRVSLDFASLSQSEKATYVTSIIERQGEYLKSLGCNLELTKNHMLNQLINDPNNFAQFHEQNTYEGFNDNLGIISFGEEWDNILMWSHYGDNHKGYVIGFDTEKLICSGLFSHGGMMLYPNDLSFPLLNPLEERTLKGFIAKTHTKMLDWNYEKEYRLFKIKTPEKLTVEERTVKIPNNFISEVIIGLKCNDSDRSEIVDICKNKAIKVFQAKQVPFKFELMKELINNS